MDQTDFAIAMVSGILIIIIIIVIFLVILLKIFGKKKEIWPIVTLLPEITEIERYDIQPGKFLIRPTEFEGLEKEFKSSRDLQKKGSVIEMKVEQKEDMSSVEPEKAIRSLNKTTQIEDNEKLKLEDILIEVRNENTPKKAKRKISSRKNLEKPDKLIERTTPEKKAMNRQVRKKSEKDHVPEPVLKVSEEKSPRKKPSIKVSKKEKKQAILNENSG